MPPICCTPTGGAERAACSWCPPVFMHYIEQPPSLGEDSVALRSIGSVVPVLPEIASDSVDDADTASVKAA